MGVLAYLAANEPRGFCERDELLALFWPEIDDVRARRSLRKTVYRLRKDLGSDTVASRGRNQIGLSERALWCDVPAFRAALEAERPKEALGLYCGDLMPAFHLSGLRRFERWLEATRHELRARAAEASWRLASDDIGRPHGQEEAVRWARRAWELSSPYDEAAIRRYVEILDKSGCRAEALAAYAEFKVRLSDELDVAPSPETARCVAKVRQRKKARQNVQ